MHFGLGYLYWKSHQDDEAKREFEAELAVDPNHANSMSYLGDIAMKQGDLDEALTWLNKAVRIKNDLRFAYVDLGAVLMQQKQYEDAAVAFQRAVELDPAEPDAHYRLARVYQAMGRTEQSQSEFAKVRELHEKADESLASKIPAAPAPAAH